MKITFSDALVAIPAGLLTLMSTLMFDALLLRVGLAHPVLSLPVLAFCAGVVGVLSGILRKAHGMGTALAAGIAAALILLGLRLFSSTDSNVNSLLFGLPGALIALALTPLGGRLGIHLRKPA